MTGIRELLAITLGVALGLVLVAAPRAALRLSVVVGPSRRKRGEYGSKAVIPETWAWIVRGLGVASLIFAASIASRTFA
ncbi:MAG: hypothetical protein ABEJ84_03990 [Halodesulfurarchaeum sp.]